MRVALLCRKPKEHPPGDERGFTLVEVIVAISILTFGLLAVGSMQIASIRGNALAGGVTEGTTWATDKMEKLKRLPWDHSDLSEGTHSDTSKPGFTISWNVADDAPVDNTKTIAVTVNWTEHAVGKSVTVRCIVPRVI